MLYTFKKYAADLGLSPEDARRAYLATHPVISFTDENGKTVQTSDEKTIINRFEMDERFIDRRTQLQLDCIAVAANDPPKNRREVEWCIVTTQKLTTLEDVEAHGDTADVVARFAGIKLD